jgi:predicted neuraminidase
MPQHACFAMTFSEPVDLSQDDKDRATRANGIQLASGELLVPMHVRGTRAASVLKSRDDGHTWTRFGEVANPEGQGGEPTIAQTKSGKVLMMLRTKDGQLWQAESNDKGETWSNPAKTGLTATSSASQIVSLRDGDAGARGEPRPHAAPLSAHRASLAGRRQKLELPSATG